MSNTENQNEATDRTNVVTESSTLPRVVESSVQIVHDDPVDEALPVVQKEKVNYEVVFFVRYNNSARPSSEDITNFFNNYGVVHHVNCPEGKNFAFVFMSSLATTAEHRRTRTTISQIIHDMTPETRFHITVASSNRGAQQQRPRYNNQGRQYNRFRRGPRYSGQRNQYTTRQDDNNGQRSVRYNRYDNGSETRRPYVRNNTGDENVSRPQRRPASGTYRTNESSFVRNTTQRQGVRRPTGQRTERSQRTQ